MDTIDPDVFYNGHIGQMQTNFPILENFRDWFRFILDQIAYQKLIWIVRAHFPIRYVFFDFLDDLSTKPCQLWSQISRYWEMESISKHFYLKEWLLVFMRIPKFMKKCCVGKSYCVGKKITFWWKVEKLYEKIRTGPIWLLITGES